MAAQENSQNHGVFVGSVDGAAVHNYAVGSLHDGAQGFLQFLHRHVPVDKHFLGDNFLLVFKKIFQSFEIAVFYAR